MHPNRISSPSRRAFEADPDNCVSGIPVFVAKRKKNGAVDAEVRDAKGRFRPNFAYGEPEHGSIES
ncbi:MAG TPA: hypothetical protein VK968_01100 [Roseimicrobium sp.]|nr:hypothetical protein [Roseimicrobium sp.]